MLFKKIIAKRKTLNIGNCKGTRIESKKLFLDVPSANPPYKHKITVRRKIALYLSVLVI
jgi:hypothetical protein